MSDQSNTYCGNIVISGRPNVGKSTLMNRILGVHLAATTPKPQTTRNRILGIYTNPPYQMLFIDTPGIHDDQQRLLNRRLNKTAIGSMVEADVILLLVEAGKWRPDDQRTLGHVKLHDLPVILVINKVDRYPDKTALLPFLQEMDERHDFAQIIPITAFREKDVSRLLTTLRSYMPEREFTYPEEEITDRSMRFISAEMIREQLMQALAQEAPYAVAVEIEDYQQSPKGIHINALIYVEREGQKKIVIGKKGDGLKKVGSEARRRISGIVEHPVHLKLWVKVKRDWRENPRLLNQFCLDSDV